MHYIPVEEIDFEMPLLEEQDNATGAFAPVENVDNTSEVPTSMEVNRESQGEMCVICWEQPQQVTLACNHQFCGECPAHWQAAADISFHDAFQAKHVSSK